MKNFRPLFSIVLLILLTSLFACQEEAQDVIVPDFTETISTETKSGELLFRISQQDGSDDNIIDGGSCTTIVFPFTVVVNGTSIEVTSEEDYDLVEDILDELEDDTDSIAIEFPIEVSFADHSTVMINSMEELEDLLDECVEDGFDDDIECLDLVYPISFSNYNEVTQQASTITIENDQELYVFLEEIQENEIVSLNYPIEFILYSGETISVNSNEELESTVELYEDSCDEEDNEGDDDYLDDTELKNYLKQSAWTVSVYDSAGVSKANLFNDFEITFLEANIVLANSASEEIEGEWETEGSDGFLQLSTEFDTEGNLRLLNKDWRIESFGNGSLKITAMDTEIEIQVTMIARE
jgi:hypothetical protein